MLCEDTLQQANDQEIQVDILINNSPVDDSVIQQVFYKVYTFNKKKLLLSKQIDSGITLKGSSVLIKITALDSENLNGIYYHELTIIDQKSAIKTAFKRNISFIQTINKD